jgi:ADP-heptose:LPS heptosyltransferase
MYRKIRAKIKEFQRKAGKLILDSRKKEKEINFEDIKKMLFIRYDGKIGDYMVSSFVYREIKKQRPDIQIDVVGISKNEPLFLKNKNINNFYRLKKTKYRYLCPLGKKLRALNYDVMIDPTEVLKNKDLYFIRKINAKINYGYAKENYKIFNKNIEKNSEHMQAVYKKILENLGFKNIEISYDIPEDSGSNSRVSEFLEENNVKDLIAVNLFGAGKTRKLNLVKSLELLEKLRKSYPGYRIILLDSPRDREDLHKVIEASKNILYYNNSETIFDSIAIIKKSEIVVSPDTSIVHIGVGLKKKVIAFYSTNTKNFNKWGIDLKNKIIKYDRDINEIDFNKENF